MDEANRTRICVGRDAEMQVLNEQLQATLVGNGGLCLVTGDTGIGKTTLLQTFLAQAEETQPHLVTAWGYCQQPSEGTRPLLPWQELLTSLAGTTELVIQDPGRKSLRFLKSARSAFKELAPDLIELLVPGVGLVMRSVKLITKKTSLGDRLTSLSAQSNAGVDADRVQLQEQYVAILERISNETPLLLLIDDMHFADKGSIDLLQRVLRVVGGRKIMIVCAIRESNESTQAESMLSLLSQGTNSDRVRSVDLDLARQERGQELVSEFVTKVIPGVPDSFVTHLIQHTGCHPLFVTELVKQFCDIGSLQQVDGRWQQRTDINWFEVPTRVEAVIADQVNALDDQVLELLQLASLHGSGFTVEVLAGVLKQSPMQVARSLSRDVPPNLIEPVGTSVVGGHRTSRFRFCHSLVRNYLLDGVDAVESVYIHEAIATQLEILAEADSAQFASELAYHFDQAQVPVKARDYYLLAGNHAQSLCALIDASASYRRALELCSEQDHQVKLVAIRHYATALTLTGNLSAAVLLLHDGVDLAERYMLDVLPFVLADQARALANLHRLDESEAVVRRAKQLAERAGDERALVRALQELGHVYNRKGEQESSLGHLQAMIKLVREHNDELELVQGLNALAWCLKELGRYRESEECLHESIELQQAMISANWSLLATTQNTIADLAISNEDYERARKYLDLAVANWQRFDHHADAVVALGNHANLANREGLYREALNYGTRCYDIDLEVLGPDHPDLAFSLSCIGESQIGLGNYPVALEKLTHASKLRQNNEVPPGNAAWTNWLLGRAMVESDGNVSQGMNYIFAAKNVFESLGDSARSELAEVNSWLSSQTSN